jgi:tRNA(fMet)-specific endonuclease VapC
VAARFLLDTGICIYIRRQRPPAVLARFRQLLPGDAVLSVITYGELVYGAERSQFREQARGQLAELTGLLPVLALPMGAGEFYGSIRAALAAEGSIIGNNDLWIAAHAMAAHLILVTNNEHEFRRIVGLEIENWAECAQR